MIIDTATAAEIHEWDKKLAALTEIREFISDRLGDLIEPLMEQHSIEIDEELVEILETPSYWQFELRRRLRALKKLQGKNDTII